MLLNDKRPVGRERLFPSNNSFITVGGAHITRLKRTDNAYNPAGCRTGRIDQKIQGEIYSQQGVPETTD